MKTFKYPDKMACPMTVIKYSIICIIHVCMCVCSSVSFVYVRPVNSPLFCAVCDPPFLPV